MRAHRVIGLACAALAAFAACADLSGFTGPPDGSTSADGGVDAFAFDAFAFDAPVDAGGDGADSGCPGHPAALFCDDFDHGQLGARWGSTSVTNATLTLNGAESVTPPSALLADVPVSNATGSAAALLRVDLPVAPRRLRSSFDIYLEAIGNRGATIGAVSVRNGLSSYDLSLFARNDGLFIHEDGSLVDGGSTQVAHPIAPIPMKTWARLVFDIDYGGSGAPATLTLTIELPPGTPATPELDHVAIRPTTTGTATQVFGGLDSVNLPSAAPWRVFFDNVLVEAP